MPLIPKKSKEMPMEKKSSSLGMAYDMKKRAKKPKFAKGGQVPSAKTESRPMPDQMGNDSKQANMASNKPPKDDTWSSTPERKQASKGMRTTPIKHPKMASSDVVQSRLRGEEDDLQSSAKTNEGKQEQPPQSDDEMDAKKQGSNPDMSKPHMSRKAYFEGGAVSQKESEEDMVDHPVGLESDNDSMGPAMEEYMEDHFAEGGSVRESMQDNFGDTSRPEDMQDTQESKDAKETSGTPVRGPSQAEYDEYNSPAKKAIRAQYGFAEGGMAEMDDQPGDEEAIEHAASIASAIMAKNRKMMAEGGQVDIDSNNEEQPNGYYHQNEDAALKENYDSDMDDVSQPEDSNLKGDSREMDSENEHDKSITDRIRRKMKSSPISR